MNVYSCACCIYRSKEAPGPHDCAVEASLQQLASTPHSVVCGSSNAAIQQSRPFNVTFPMTVPHSHVYRGNDLYGRSMASSAATSPHSSLRRALPQRRSNITCSRLRGHFHGDDVFHGRHMASTGPPILLPLRPLLQPHAHGRPAKLRPQR